MKTEMLWANWKVESKFSVMEHGFLSRNTLFLSSDYEKLFWWSVNFFRQYYWLKTVFKTTGKVCWDLKKKSFSKNVDFSLCATTHKQIICCTIFPFLAHCIKEALLLFYFSCSTLSLEELSMKSSKKQVIDCIQVP